MAVSSSARKTASSVSLKQRGGTGRGIGNGPGSVATQFRKGEGGRKRGSKNKITVAQRETARQMFTPLAKAGLTRGKAHLKDCKVDGCVSCFQWAKIAFEYAYGKPTQPLEFDPVALRTELESIAATAGKTVEEIEQEAYEAGVRVLADRGARPG